MLGPRPQEHDLQPRIRKTARAHWLQCTAGGLLSMNPAYAGRTTWSAHSGVAFMGQRLVDIGNRRVGEQIAGFVVAGGIAFATPDGERMGSRQDNPSKTNKHHEPTGPRHGGGGI